MTYRLVISILDGLHYRYLVDTGILAIVAQEDVLIHVVTTPALGEKLRADPVFATGKITIGPLQKVSPSRMQRLYMFLINNTNPKLSETLNVKNELKKKTSKLAYTLTVVSRYVHRYFFYRWLLHLTARSFHSKYYRNILSGFNPQLVVLSTPGQKVDDLPILYECIRQKIPTLSPVYSWDNLTAKGPFIFPVDRLIVWNEIMRREAIDYHGYAPKQVDVAGVPVFDRYLAVVKEPESHRAEFRKQFGFDPNIPLVTLTTIPTIYFGKSHAALAVRMRAFAEQGLLPPFNILIRPHPLDDTDYRHLEKNPGIVVDYYGSAPEKNSLATWTPREDNILHLARTMKYSDIVINIASTITIDAACFDTPVINIAYDIKENESDYMGSIARYYHYTHYKHVVEANAAIIVRSDEHLLNAMQTYFRKPSHLSAERRQLVEKQTGELDGKAHARVAEFIIATLKQS